MKKFLNKFKKFLRTCKCKCMVICCKTKMECKNNFKDKIRNDSLTNLAIQRPINGLTAISVTNL